MGLFYNRNRKRVEALLRLVSAMGDETPGALPRQLPDEGDLLNILRQQCDGAVRQLRDTLGVLDATAAPDTYYQRVDFARKRLDALRRVRDFDKSLLQIDVARVARDLDAALPKLEDQMWARAYDKAVAAARTRKTRDGQLKVFTRFFDLADRYDRRLSPPARKTIARCRANMQTLMS